MSSRTDLSLPDRPDLADPEALARTWGADLQPRGCSHCGAVHLVAIDGAMTCPTCLQAEMEPQPARVRAEPPELVLPFRLSREETVSRLSAWSHGVRLRPPDLNADAIVARLRPVFLPMWLVDGTVLGSWQAEVGFDYEVASAQEELRNGEWRTRKTTETRIRWEPRAGALRRAYANRLTPALADHPAITRALGKFDYDAWEPYAPELIAGAAIRAPDLPPDEVWHLAEPAFERAAAADCRAASDAQHLRDFAIDAAYSELNWTLLLLPAYASFYRDDEGNVIPITVNGQSGQVHGVLRASLRRGWLWSGAIGAAAVVLFLVGALIALLSVVAPPALVVGAVFFVVSLIVGVAAAVPVIYAWRWNAGHKP